MQHRPRKRFGQNFLQNQLIIESILNAFNPKAKDNVIEIGPGLGALTKHLLKNLDYLTVIEIDKDLATYLRAMPEAMEKLKVIEDDALSVDYGKFGEDLRVIGNLPYNISTPILLKLFQYSPFVKDMIFMLQKEVVLRLAAEPGCKAYGRLSVAAQYHCEVIHLFDVPATAFYPEPKVESAIVRLIPHKNLPFSDISWPMLMDIVASAFSMRRKTLANNLKSIISAKEIEMAGINPSLRPEQISIAEYAKLAKLGGNFVSSRT